MKSIVGFVIVAWLVVGALAAYQRGYFGDQKDVSCKTAGDTSVTVAAGPLNYMGANPKVDCNVAVPQPSK